MAETPSSTEKDWTNFDDLFPEPLSSHPNEEGIKPLDKHLEDYRTLRTALNTKHSTVDPSIMENAAQQEQPVGNGSYENFPDYTQDQASLQTGEHDQGVPNGTQYHEQYQDLLSHAEDYPASLVREGVASGRTYTGPTTRFTFVSTPTELSSSGLGNISGFTFVGEQDSMNHPLPGDMAPPPKPMSPPLTPRFGTVGLKRHGSMGHTHRGVMMAPSSRPMAPPPPRFIMPQPPRPMGPSPSRSAANTRYGFVNTNSTLLTATPTAQAPSTPLFYNSAAAAEAAQNARDLQWPLRTHDPSFPLTDRERVHYVQRLVTAMRDLSAARDVPSNPAFKKRWLDPQSQGHYGYPLETFELACWGILKATERLHTYGLACFSIYEKGTLDKALKEKDLSFEERVGVMCDYLRFTKGKVDSLLKGDGVETFVAAAGGKLRESKLNKAKRGGGVLQQAPQKQQQVLQQVLYRAPQQPSQQHQQPPPSNPNPNPGPSLSFQQQIFHGQAPQWYYGGLPGTMHLRPNPPVQQHLITSEDWTSIMARYSAKPSAESPSAAPSQKRTLDEAGLSDDEEGGMRDGKKRKE
ncbi:hypothetical protein PTT_19496 [Pyrenophora teres f. teres 0-1]|uniref:Uncharacterized protein n=1 Tax=Pyrenophora teres f. teres (strain 0-1) TaxID=861557 RepID=E3S906_PYRTT|nr:hypothetical protein PTT_19496 [Pyrenophora teres f. teres 0-1]KAE8840707.1 hypothetical protein PTNB85_04106 [Pyrenophora teres f. teres]KAE8849153.1 hypothetical protein HRS9122_03169 [Pyrenophora teres f. teres]